MNSVKAKLIVEVGDDHNAVVNTTVPEGTEVVYFTGLFAGAVDGMKRASDFLVEVLPDDLSDKPLDFQIQAAAGKASKSI